MAGGTIPSSMLAGLSYVPPSILAKRKAPGIEDSLVRFISLKEIKKEVREKRKAFQRSRDALRVTPDELKLADRLTSAYLDLAFNTLLLNKDSLDHHALSGSYLDPGLMWCRDISPFYKKEMVDEEILALYVAVAAARHHSDGFGGFDLQTLAHAGGMEGRSRLERGRYWKNICELAEKALPRDHLGSDFVASSWWRVFKTQSARGLCWIDGYGLRYQSLKEQIVKEFANSD